MLLVLLGLVLCTLTVLYLYVRQCNNYWQKRGIITVKTNFFFGTSFDYLTGRRSHEQIHHDIYKAAPNEPYVGIYNILKPVLFIRDPDLVHRMTVKDFTCFHDRDKMSSSGGPLKHSVFALRGEEWRTVRNKLKPTFSGSKMRKMFQLMEGCAERLVETRLRAVAGPTEPVEIQEIMTRYTLDVLGCCAFGLQFNTLNDSDSFFYKTAKMIANFFSLGTFIVVIMQMLTPNLAQWIGITNERRLGEVENFFFDLLHQAEEVRRKESEHRGDLLQLMLDIRDAEDSNASYLFTDKHIASNMFLFYFAGHETTSTALAFTLYELAIHPEIQDKLRNEIEKAKEANDGTLDYITVKKIAYLEMVILETLRLHPPVSVTARSCTEVYQLPGSLHKLKPGDEITYSTIGMHKDERYFSNPERFDPEQFSVDNVARRNPNAFQPFGSGPRICLGERFAKLEMKICLVRILLRYKLSHCSKTEIPIIMNPKSFLHSAKNGIWLSIEEII